MPGGICRIAGCDAAVNCATAAETCTPGWKKIFHHAGPVQRLRFDVVDVVHRRRQDTLVTRR